MEQPSETVARQAKKGNKMNKAAPVAAEKCSKTDSSPQRPFAFLTRPIAKRLTEVVPTGDSCARADRCLSALQSMMEWLGPQWDVQPFGSFANGFGTFHSDLDVTCCHRGNKLDGDSQRIAASDLSNLILPMIRQHNSFSIVEEILGARVPILKLRFENVLDVDVSCHNAIPVNNTQLLRAYSRMDSRIKALGLAIKLWAKSGGVCDATKSNLSSYSFTLLVIYFLQVHPDSQLPTLPVEAFEDGGKHERDERVIAAMAGWHCSLSLAELVARFFAFYSGNQPNAFVWGDEVVAVRSGARTGVQHPSFYQLRGRHARRLHIQDPFQVQRNLHCVLGESEEEQLRTAFSDAWHDIQSNCVPLALRSADPRYQPSMTDAPVSPCSVKHDVPVVPTSASSADSWLQKGAAESWLQKGNLNKDLNVQENLLKHLVIQEKGRSFSNCSQAVGSSANSTKSGGTSRTTGSDDDSCNESGGESSASATLVTSSFVD